MTIEDVVVAVDEAEVGLVVLVVVTGMSKVDMMGANPIENDEVIGVFSTTVRLLGMTSEDVFVAIAVSPVRIDEVVGVISVSGKVDVIIEDVVICVSPAGNDEVIGVFSTSNKLLGVTPKDVFVTIAVTPVRKDEVLGVISVSIRVVDVVIENIVIGVDVSPMGNDEVRDVIGVTSESGEPVDMKIDDVFIAGVVAIEDVFIAVDVSTGNNEVIGVINVSAKIVGMASEEMTAAVDAVEKLTLKVDVTSGSIGNV